MGRSILVFVGGLALGLGLGWLGHVWLGGGERAAVAGVGAVAPTDCPPAAAASRALGGAAGARSARPSAPAGAVAEARGLAAVPAHLAVVGAVGEEEAGAVALELERLRARVRELEWQATAEEEARVERDGRGVQAPPDLPERFGQEPLRRAMDEALREIGLKGQVTDVDCSEYPCLVSGELSEGEFGREESERLGGAAALAPYGEDQRASFGSTMEGRDGESRRVFAVAVWQRVEGPTEKAEILKRLHSRWAELQEALRTVGE